MREGRELPKAIRDAPELAVGLTFYYEAFCDLSSCRSVGGGSDGFIPWTAMNEYCGFYQVNGDDRVRFFFMIEKMDRVYLEILATKRKEEMNRK